MGDIDDNQPDMQKALEEALKREIGGLLKKAGREFGSIIFKYILVFFVLFISISMLVILIFFMPSLSIKYAADSLKNVFVGSDSHVDASDWGSPIGDLTFEEVGGRITGHFGEDRGDHKHRGVDIAVPEGTALYAAVSGTVSNASETDTEGKHVYIDTEDGYKFMYMHMSEIAVSAGQSVSKGDYIGKSGNTGDSTGPHLHYQIFSPSGVGVCWAESAIWLVDPEPYLTAGSSGSGSDGENTGIELSPDEVDEFWYNARNVKANLDALYEAVSDMNNGIEYITKDNFTMILDKVITYSESVRRVAYEYTYYQHLYKRELTYSYQKDTPKEDTDDNTGGTDAGTPMDDQVSAQGVTINDSSNTEDIVEREWEDDDGKHEIITTWKTTDIERDDEVGHVQNASPEDDPIFKISWEEIYTMAAMKSVVQNGQERNWETESKLEDVERPDINGIARLSEETVKQIINEFQFNIMYYFDPTSGDTMEGSSDTYASHSYTYDEMDKYAYTKSKEGENVEHGTEVAGETSNFDYYEYKKPAIAPAIATNAYTTIEYDYTEQGDGTAILAGRQVIIDGQKFYNHVRDILGEDFDLEWFVQFLSMLPGVNYDAGNGDLQTRFNQILTSYKNGEPYSYYDSDFDGVGKVILGSECSREPKISTRRDAEGNPIDIPEYNITITIDDISDEQIKADIEACLYTMEDLVFMSACAQAEAGSVEGQVAVSWLLRNRLRLGNYASIKEVVEAPGQFASPWASYLNGSYSSQAQSCAASVLRGEVENPVGDAYFFFSASSCWGHLPGVWYRNVGGNMYYCSWGDVTQIVGREGYVPF